jgi:hypothetical protein
MARTPKRARDDFEYRGDCKLTEAIRVVYNRIVREKFEAGEMSKVRVELDREIEGASE